MRENTWLVKSVGYYLKTVIINIMILQFKLIMYRHLLMISSGLKSLVSMTCYIFKLSLSLLLTLVSNGNGTLIIRAFSILFISDQYVKWYPSILSTFGLL